MRLIDRRMAVAPLAIAVAACFGTTTPPSKGSPSTSPNGSLSSSPSVAPSRSVPPTGIDHATGATDVVLRYEEGGGFMAPGFLATQAPIFSLYGDGTAIFRNPRLEGPPAVGSVFLSNPFRTARLSEDQIQETLRSALVDGGLGIARAEYQNDGVADAGTTTFTIAAGGVTKTISVYALGIETPGGKDALARAAFQRLADRLSDFDRGGSVTTDVYRPTRYRGILIDGQPTPDQRGWPWTDLAPTDFAFPVDPDAFRLATHVLTAGQVDKLAVDGSEGGLQGLVVQSPDRSRTYSLSIRPLLPDEAA